MEIFPQKWYSRSNIVVSFKYDRTIVTAPCKYPKSVFSASIVPLTLQDLREIRKLFNSITLDFVLFQLTIKSSPMFNHRLKKPQAERVPQNMKELISVIPFHG